MNNEPTKSVLITVRTTEAERSDINAIAKALGVNVADLIRDYLREYANDHREKAKAIALAKAEAISPSNQAQ